MNRILAMASLTFAVALISNCKGVRNLTVSSEAVEHVSTFWKFKNNIDTPYLTIPEKAWYQGNTGITQICRIRLVETETSKSTIIETIGYRFIDLQKKWAYEYGSFTDTATVTSKYRYTDSTLFPGGWKFDYRTPTAINSFYFLSDTIINAIVFKRYKVNFEFNRAKFESIGLFRCDKKNARFQIEAELSNKVGCQLVSMRMNPITNSHAIVENEIKFISNILPDSVLKVFAAWKRNESITPVQ